MGERASIRVKSGSDETKEAIYLHWGGDHVGEILMAAEANATTTNADDCLTEIYNAAQTIGYSPSRDLLDECGDGSNAGNFLIDVSKPAWKVEIESEYGYGLLGESNYHFGLKEFRVPDDVNGRPEDDGRTDSHEHRHLFNAVKESDTRMVQALLDAGADPNFMESGFEKRTPLHQIAYNDEGGKIAQLLVDAGADLTLKDDQGYTAKQIAARNEEVLEVIERREAFLESQRRQGELTKVAQSTRAGCELASPEEALARRSRGRSL